MGIPVAEPGEVCKKKGTTAAKSKHFEAVKDAFLDDMVAVVSIKNIPVELIVSWDQTGIHLVPVSMWTMVRKESE